MVQVANIHVLLVEDHVILRQVLAESLRTQPGIDVVGQAGNGKEAIRLASQLQPHVVIMDVSMPVMDGIEATSRITARWPEIRVIGFSMHDELDMARRMQDAGAHCYMMNGSPLSRLVIAIVECFDAPTALYHEQRQTGFG